jgi:catechol 2,3-dioxygenase-like lactoylglutathione lyase family enzyme
MNVPPILAWLIASLWLLGVPAHAGEPREIETQNEAVRVTGIGGVFIYANDPEELAQWYGRHFGLPFSQYGEEAIYYTVFYCRDEREPAKRLDTTFSIMPAKKALPLERSEFMVNYRVDNLEEFLEQLRRIGIEIEKVEDYDYGRFAWIRDPEGNRIELYQPLPASETH